MKITKLYGEFKSLKKNQFNLYMLLIFLSHLFIFLLLLHLFFSKRSAKQHHMGEDI